jgi:hypothetical protein
VIRGAFPVGLFADDLTVERELLEAPSNEPTLLGGFFGPCVDLPARRPGLGELLDVWHAATWGGRPA